MKEPAAQGTAKSTSPRPSAGGVVVNPEGKLLVVQQHNNSWSFPKGGVNEGESEYDAALREIREETGLTKLEFVCELGSYERYSIGKDGVGEERAWGIRKRTFFLFTTEEGPSGTFNDPDGEITAVRFVTADETLALLTHPKDKEFLQSVRGKIKDILK